jgi:hypothetical protein
VTDVEVPTKTYYHQYLHQLNTPTLDFGGKVWKDDSGTNRVVKQLVDVKRYVGQEVYHPFGVRMITDSIYNDKT